MKKAQESVIAAEIKTKFYTFASCKTKTKTKTKIIMHYVIDLSLIPLGVRIMHYELCIVIAC